jgi:hypothetical protein
VHPALLVAFGHFLVNNSASCGYPLNVTGRDRASVANAVRMVNRSGKGTRDRLDTTLLCL